MLEGQDDVYLLFDRWDLTGTGKISIGEVEQMIATFAPTEPEELAKQSIRRDLANVCQEKHLNRFMEVCQANDFSISIDRPQLYYTISTMFPSNQLPLFIAHVYNTLDYVNDLTEAARQNKAIWALFQQWVDRDTGTVHCLRLFEVVSETEPFKSDVPACRLVMNTVVGAYAQKGLTLQLFHQFIRSVLSSTYWPTHEFYTALRDLQTTWNQKKESEEEQQRIANTCEKTTTPHSWMLPFFNPAKAKTKPDPKCPLKSVSAYAYSDATEPSPPSPPPLKHTVPTTATTRLHDASSPTLVNIAEKATREQQHNKVEAEGRVQRLTVALRHCWDGVKAYDLEVLTEQTLQRPPTWIQIVVAPACILLGIPAEQTWQDDYFKAFQHQIQQSSENLLQRFKLFEVESVTDAQMKHVMAYVYNAEFNSNFLLQFSVVYSAIADWVHTLIKLLGIAKQLEFQPNVTLQEPQHTIFANSEHPPPPHPQVESATEHLLQLLDKTDITKLITTRRSEAQSSTKNTASPSKLPQLNNALKVLKNDGIEISTYKGADGAFLAHPFVQTSLDIRRKHTLIMEPQMTKTAGVLETHAPKAILGTTTVSTTAAYPTPPKTMATSQAPRQALLRPPPTTADQLYTTRRASAIVHQQPGGAVTARATSNSHRMGTTAYTPSKRYHKNRFTATKINQVFGPVLGEMQEEEKQEDPNSATQDVRSTRSTLSLSSLLTVPSDMFMRRTTETHGQHLAMVDALNEEMEAYNSPFAFIAPEIPPTAPRPEFQTTNCALYDDLT